MISLAVCCLDNFIQVRCYGVNADGTRNYSIISTHQPHLLVVFTNGITGQLSIGEERTNTYFRRTVDFDQWLRDFPATVMQGRIGELIQAIPKQVRKIFSHLMGELRNLQVCMSGMIRASRFTDPLTNVAFDIFRN